MITYTPIGVIHSPFKEAKGTPIQFSSAGKNDGKIEIFPDYIEGLEDLNDFSHIILIYDFHRAKRSSLKVIPFMDTEERGVFATRAPRRPNPIGFSVVQLNKIENSILYISGLDILDGTPLLDIKPFVSDFDNIKATKKGWLDKNVNKLPETNDDGRFT